MICRLIEGIEGSTNLKSMIKLEKEVTNIDVKDEKTVTVTTKDGECMNGDFVIVTVPLGVLKSQTLCGMKTQNIH